MTVSSARFTLVASHPTGVPVTTAEFLTPLAAAVEGVVEAILADRGAWASGKVVFGGEDLAAYRGGTEPHEAFETAILARLLAVAAWLEPREQTLRDLARGGLRLEFVVDLWMNQDQMDLRLPPNLLVSLGRAGIGVYVLSNE